MSALQQDLHERGIVSRPRRLKSGRTVGGIPFYKGPLAWLLKNRTYIGEVSYRGKIFQGQHQPIIDRKLFDAVQEKLTSNTHAFKRGRATSESLLIGKLYDDAGNRMTPVSSHKGTIRYRYYQSAPTQNGAKKPLGSVTRVPAPEIEAAVLEALRSKLKEDQSASTLDDRAVIAACLDQTMIAKGELRVRFRKTAESETDQNEIRIPFRVRNAPPERKVIGGKMDDACAGEVRSDKRKRLIRTMAKARAWADDLASSKVKDVAHIARREGTCERFVRMTLPLAFLSPKIVSRTLQCAMPAQPLRIAVNANFPVTWRLQVQLLLRS